jgi:hypothetical protein
VRVALGWPTTSLSACLDLQTWKGFLHHVIPFAPRAPTCVVKSVGSVIPIVVVASFDAGDNGVPNDVFTTSDDSFVFGTPSEIHPA